MRVLEVPVRKFAHVHVLYCGAEHWLRARDLDSDAPKEAKHHVATVEAVDETAGHDSPRAQPLALRAGHRGAQQYGVIHNALATPARRFCQLLKTRVHNVGAQ